MSLETGSYINDLVITNPTASDAKSQGDDHIRMIKAALKETLNGFTGAILLTATDTGSATAHVLTPATALVGYTAMLCLLYLPAVTNTGAITVNVSGLGAKSIKTLAGADPTAGDIVAGAPVLLMYNGTNFVNLAGSEFLSKTGNQTLTGTMAVTSDASVGGNATVTGALGVTGNTTLGGSLAVTGTATGVTPTAGDSSTKFATTAFVVAQAFAAALPGISGATAGQFITNNGSVASWAAIPPATGSIVFTALNFGAF